MAVMKGITEVRAKIVSGERPGARIKSNGKAKRIFTVAAITENLDALTIEVDGSIEIPEPDTNIRIKGVAKITDWASEYKNPDGTSNVNSGITLYMNRVLKLDVLPPGELDEEIFALRQVNGFTQKLGPTALPSVD